MAASFKYLHLDAAQRTNSFQVLLLISALPACNACVSVTECTQVSALRCSLLLENQCSVCLSTDLSSNSYVAVNRLDFLAAPIPGGCSRQVKSQPTKFNPSVRRTPTGNAGIVKLHFEPARPAGKYC